MEPLVTLIWMAAAFGVWYALRRARGGSLGPRSSSRDGAKRQTRLRTVEGPRQPARTPRAGAEVRAIDDPVTALATLALVMTGEDRTPTKDVERTLRERLSALTDEVHVARAMRAAQRAASRGDNPNAVIRQLAPIFERSLTARERADVVVVCEDVISANGIISDHQSVWLRSLRRSLGFEVKG